MLEVYGSKFISLHVRKGNHTAYHLYKDTLGFTCVCFCLHASSPVNTALCEGVYCLRAACAVTVFEIHVGGMYHLVCPRNCLCHRIYLCRRLATLQCV